MCSMSFANQIMELDVNIRSGTLQFYGCWFGRPMDNFHKSTSAEEIGSTLKVEFSEGETLEVVEPSEILTKGTTLIIPKAKSVKWSWYYYGKPKIKDNLLSLEYLVQGNEVSINSKIALPKKVSASELALQIC